MLKAENFEKEERKSQGSLETVSPIRSLIDALHSEDGVVRREARQTLVFIGRPAVDLLIPLLKEPDDDVRWETAKALAEIADSRAATELVPLLLDHNFGVRWVAGEALIAIGRDALIPVVEKLTERSDSAWLRRGAHHVLKDLAKKNMELQNILAPLIAALEGTEPEIGVLDPAYTALDRLRGSHRWFYKA